MRDKEREAKKIESGKRREKRRSKRNAGKGEGEVEEKKADREAWSKGRFEQELEDLTALFQEVSVSSETSASCV